MSSAISVKLLHKPPCFEKFIWCLLVCLVNNATRACEPRETSNGNGFIAEA